MANEIVQGDNGSILELVIQDDSQVIDLTNATVQVVLTYKTTGRIKPAVIIDAVNGKCEVTLTSEDIMFEGVYAFQATVTFDDGRKFTSNIQRFNVLKKIGFIPNTGGGTGGGSTEVVSGVNGHILVNGIDVKVYDDTTVKGDITNLKNSQHSHTNKAALDKLGLNEQNKLTIDGIEFTNGGSGILTYQTLADLQTAYPNGINQPVWIISENAWYYWSGTVSDTTAPVLTITTGGTFTGTKSVTMSVNETATIYYTIDGSAPTTSSTVYSSPLSISATTTLKAFAKDTAGNSSAVQTVTYTLDSTPPADTTAPNNVTNLSHSNLAPTSLTLTWTASASSDVASYDVFNGSTLLANVTGTTYNVTGLTDSTQYTFTVKAKDGANNTASGASVTVTTSAPTDTTAPVLTITPAATFTDTQTVNMSTNETATIWYTLDDSDPKTSGTKIQYASPITLTETDTIKAYAADTAGNASTVQTVTYTKQASTSIPSGAIVYDSFNRADSSTTLGVTDTGHSYQILSGSAPKFGIEGNQAKKFTGASDYVVVDSGISDGYVEITFSTLATDQRLIFRATDLLNNIILTKNASNQYQLIKVVAGAATVLQTLSVTPANGDVIRATLNANNITMSVNGVSQTTISDSNFTTATKHGFGSKADLTAKWDNFIVGQ